MLDGKLEFCGETGTWGPATVGLQIKAWGYLGGISGSGMFSSATVCTPAELTCFPLSISRDLRSATHFIASKIFAI